MSYKIMKTSLFGYNKIDTCNYFNNIYNQYEKEAQMIREQNENEIRILEQRLNIIKMENKNLF